MERYQRSSDANVITEQYMDSILIESRYIGAVKADTTVDFLGETFGQAGKTLRRATAGGIYAVQKRQKR